MMEKYAVSLEDIPPTDDQIRTIRELKKSYDGFIGGIPKTASEADELIREIELSLGIEK